MGKSNTHGQDKKQEKEEKMLEFFETLFSLEGLIVIAIIAFGFWLLTRLGKWTRENS